MLASIMGTVLTISINAATLVSAAVSPAKILLGVNFYGVDFVRPDVKGSKAEPERKPIVAKELMEVLQKAKPKLAWDKESAEHVFKYKVSRFALVASCCCCTWL
jgi:spore germination protein YaaH